MLSPGTKWSPLSDWVRVRRCTGGVVEKDEHGHPIYWKDGMPVAERSGDTSWQFVVIGVGPKCKLIRPDLLQEAAESGQHVRCFVEEDCGQFRIHDEDFVVREDKIIPFLIIG